MAPGRGLAFSSLLLIAAGCGGTRECRDGTLFLTLSYPGATAGADDLDLTITVGASSVHPTFSPHPGGDTLQVDFPDGYPAGQTVTVDAIAREQGVPVGEGHATTALATGCTALSLTLDPSLPDAAAPSDAAIAIHDLAIDATPAPDLFPGCPSVKPLFADTFAKATLDPTWYAISAGSGSYNLDTMVGHDDARSLHLRGGPFADNGGYVEGVGESQSLQNKPPRLFLRAWILLPAPSVLASNVRIFDLSARQVMNTPSLSLVLLNNYGLSVENRITGNVVTTMTGAGVVPPLKWFCLQIEAVFAKPNGFNVWVDGTPIGAISGNTPMVPAGGPIDSLEFEILQIFAPAQAQPFDVYLDQVAVDSCPIGCQ